MTPPIVDLWRKNNMEQGFIFTKDKTELEVFFLKPQDPPKELFLDDSPAFNEIDVKENSDGVTLANCMGHYAYDNEGTVTEIKDSCPIGPKGETGPAGINEDDTLYSVIFDSVKRFENTELNIASKTAQEILAMVIEKRVKALLDYKGNLD